MTPRRLAAAAAVAAASLAFTACTSPAPAAPDAERSTTPPPVVEASPTPTPSSTPTPDPWVGFYDEFAEEIKAESAVQFWGSFGDPGAVAVADHRDLTLAAGTHQVIVECVGPALVTVTLSAIAPGDGSTLAEPSETYDLECPGGVVLELTTTDPGLAAVLDSHGEAGAFLVRMDPGTTDLAG